MSSPYNKLALDALEHYQLPESRIEFIGQNDNITYQILPQSGEDSFLLKIHNPSNSLTMVESELMWLEALSMDKNLITPSPFRNIIGQLVTEVKRENEQQSTHVTMQYWVRGEILGRQPTAPEVQALSSLMAGLHHHSQTWSIPDGFSRPLYGPDQLNCSCKQIKLLADKGIISSSVYEIILETEGMIVHELAAMPVSNETWGLIHSDLHESNYVFYNGEARPIDFSACGFGYYLFDVAETLLHLTRDNRKMFVSAYGKYHALPDEFERKLEAFFLWAVFRGYAFHSVNPDEYQYLSENVPAIVNHYCKKYLRGDPFLLRG